MKNPGGMRGGEHQEDGGEGREHNGRVNMGEIE